MSLPPMPLLEFVSARHILMWNITSGQQVSSVRVYVLSVFQKKKNLNCKKFTFCRTTSCLGFSPSTNTFLMTTVFHSSFWSTYLGKNFKYWSWLSTHSAKQGYFSPHLCLIELYTDTCHQHCPSTVSITGGKTIKNQELWIKYSVIRSICKSTPPVPRESSNATQLQLILLLKSQIYSSLVGGCFHTQIGILCESWVSQQSFGYHISQPALKPAVPKSTQQPVQFLAAVSERSRSFTLQTGSAVTVRSVEVAAGIWDDWHRH